MKRILHILLIFVAFLVQPSVDVRADLVVETNEERKVREFLPKLTALGQKYSTDSEIQLGLAYIYTKFGGSTTVSAKERFDKVLAIDPDNKPALAALSRIRSRGYTATRNNFRVQLEVMIAVMEKRGKTDLSIPTYSSLYAFFDGDGENPVAIPDFDSARRQLHEKIDQKYPPTDILAEMNEAQVKDETNALYNYLKAHIYLDTGQTDMAVKEIEEGVSKQYFSTYQEVVGKATARVLQEVDFPQVEGNVIASTRSPFEDFLVQAIWKQGIAERGKDYENQGDFESAGRIYRLTIAMAKQVQPESKLILGLDKVAEKRIEGLVEKGWSEIPGATDPPYFRSTRYVFVFVLCAGIIVTVILLQKRNRTRSGK
jgi:tetratricopeptide (TPR) repeat protein